MLINPSNSSQPHYELPYRRVGIIYQVPGSLHLVHSMKTPDTPYPPDRVSSRVQGCYVPRYRVPSRRAAHEI